MCISDELYPYLFHRKMEKMRYMKEEMDGKAFISRQPWHFSFVNFMIKVTFPINNLTWYVNNYVSRRGKGINKKNESTKLILLLFVTLNITSNLR